MTDLFNTDDKTARLAEVKMGQALGVMLTDGAIGSGVLKNGLRFTGFCTGVVTQAVSIWAESVVTQLYPELMPGSIEHHQQIHFHFDAMMTTILKVISEGRANQNAEPSDI